MEQSVSINKKGNKKTNEKSFLSSFGDLKVNYQLYLLVALPVIYIFIFQYIPIYGVQIAFKDFNVIKGITGSEWIGFEYFTRFFDSYMFWDLIKNTLGISIYHLAAGFPIPIILALCLNYSFSERFKKVVQMVTYAPHFISTVVMVGMVLQFLSMKTGIVNQFIENLGFEPVHFMGKSEFFSSIYVWSGIWQNAGWGTIIYLAALAGVDKELHEAAIVDGAGIFKRVLNIDIPGIMPTMMVLLIMNFGQIMSVGFEKVLLLQNPMNISVSEVISTYVYRVGLSSAMPNYSYATAIGLFNSIINFILLIFVNKLSKKLSDSSLW